MLAQIAARNQADRASADQKISAPPESGAEQISYEQFRYFAENLPTLCWMANADGYIFWYNRRWHEYCGSTPEQMQGWGWQSVHDPAVLPDVLERWRGSIATGKPFEMTFPLRGADGIFRPFLTRILPMRGDDGRIVRWFGVNTDVSAQVEAEARLTAANREYQAIAAERDALLGQLCEGVIITDPEGRIKFVNAAAVELHGVERLDVEPDQYVVSYSLFTEAGDEHPVDDLPLTRAVRHHETVQDAHWRIRRPDGTDVIALGNAQPYYRDDGTMIGAVLTIRDDTRRHVAAVALEEAVRAKEMLLQELNHRIKNSLQLVSSLLTLQANRSKSLELKQGLIEAGRRISVVASLHERLYSFGLHDRVDISEYLRELAAETIAALDSGQAVDLRFVPAPDVRLALDRAVPLALIISELMTNALKYAFAEGVGGTIDLAIKERDGKIEIILADDGAGLPDDFQPARSAGLGMRIVTALTRQIGGELTIIERAKGAGFRLMLPVEV
jgi:PAS domain S-box-containing protein